MMKLIPVLVLLTLAGIGGTGYFYWEYQKAQKEIKTIKTDPSTAQKAAQEEVKKLTAEVGMLVELPQDEDPTVATVIDAEKLKEQPFFAKTQNDDKVLIYTKAKKAILYRPSTKKIIDIGPIRDVQDESGQAGDQAASPSPSPANVVVTLYNGTNNAGLTNKVETTLKSKYTNLDIRRDSSVKKEYENTLVVDLSGKFKDMVKNIITTLSAQSGPLPEGEVKPTTDVLVIVGKDAI